MTIYNPTADELAEVGQVIDDSQYVLDPSKEWDPIQYTFSYNGIGLAPMGDLHVVKAPQKNGKTFLLTLMMGAMLNGEYMGLKCEIDNPRVLFVDTEQHPRNTQLVYRRVCRICGIEEHSRHDNFRVLHTRGTQVAEVRQILLQNIVFWKPTAIFIDGLVDLVIDPNDQEESKAYITLLSGIAMRHNCSIWTVLHVNPGSEKMRGHLGTILAQKASDVLMCSKTKTGDGTSIFTVEQTDTRNKDIPKFVFEIRSIKGNDGDYLAMPVAPYVSDKEIEQMDKIIQKVFDAGGPLLTSGEISTHIQQICGVKERTAREYRKKAIEMGLITVDSVTNRFHYFGIPRQRDDIPF